MPRIPEAEIERIKRQINLSDLCRSRGIELKPHGKKDLMGKCPFHDDENPSFVVTPDKNLFHCMGCDAAGSVIDFVMKADGLDFKAAVDKLMPALSKVEGPGLRGGARDAVPVAEKERPPVPPERASQLMERVISIYEKTFTEVSEGRAYLERRGITDAGLFTRHRIGYCNGRLSEILPKGSDVREELRTLGVLLGSPHKGAGLAGQERFTGCAVFPVFDPEGNLVTLYGRFTGESQKRHVFLPERSTGLWNATAMKTYPDLILVESVIDALSVMMAGHPNVLAIQGTNGLNDADLALFREHGTQTVTLLLDGDEAGRKASERLKEKVSSSFSCRLLMLPGGHDPNSFLVEHGPQKLAEFITGNLAAESVAETAAVRAAGGNERTPPALPAGSLAVAFGVRRYEIRGLEKGQRRLKATLRVEHAGKLHVDTLDFYSARSRRILAQDLCRFFEETPETIEADIDKLLRHCETLPEKTTADAGLEGRPAEVMIPPQDRVKAEAFGKSKRIFDDLLSDFEACGLVGEKANKLLCYLAMTSRKMEDPISVLILSSSGAGKTVLQDTALSFCPPEDLVKLTSLSGKALFYKEQFSLRHKALSLEEGAGAEEASYAIRNLISARELVIESAIKDPASGKITTMTNRVEGPTAVFITTTDPDTDPETRSRFFVTSIDESREQTRAILAFQRRRHTLAGLSNHGETDAILLKHRNFQRLLRPVKVMNPFAERLTYGDDRLQGRRDQPKYLNLIKAVAFLRQMQKAVKMSPQGREYVEVDADDIRLANDLATEILGKSLDELSAPGRNLLLQIEAMVEARLKDRKPKAGDEHDSPRCGGNFTRREVREFTGWANARVHRYLKELCDFEYVLMDTGRNGVTCRYRLAWDGQGKDGSRFVPGLGRNDDLGLKNAKDLDEPEG